MAEFDEKLNALLSNPESMAQIMQLAQSLSGGIGGTAGAAPPPPPQASVSPPPPQASFPTQPSSNQASAAPSGTDFLSSLAGGLDSNMLGKLLPLVQELGQDSNARQLLYALRPYLKPERQEKVERALQLARLFHLGKKFLAGWEG